MKKEDIHWDDWHRILIGAAPTHFLLEVLIRTVVMYFALLIVLRLMGKRMGGQLTISELAVMVTLGAIICVPMQVPDKGIVQGIFVLFCAWAFQRGLTWIGFKSSKMENLIQGKEAVLIKDGVIEVKDLEDANISRQQLYGVLRSQNIYNLGAVERVYIEASGLFSVFKFDSPRPGLSIFPSRDGEVLEGQQKPDEVFYVCRMCGKPAKNEKERNGHCENCSCENWEEAIMS
jgi:uncharacterized membrane protein YcaP (DUF421 family)